MNDITAALGISDPAKALSDLGIYTGAQKQALAQKVQAEQPGAPETFEELWAAKYGPNTPGVTGVKTEESGGNEVFPLPGSMPMTANTGPGGGPVYNPEIGRVFGFSPDGQIMTSKTHPYLMGLLGNRGPAWDNGGDTGGTADGGRADGQGEE